MLLSMRISTLLAQAPLERMDISVLKASIAVAFVFGALVIAFHLGGVLVRKLAPPRRGTRQSPEPPAWPSRDVLSTVSLESEAVGNDGPDTRIQAKPVAVAVGRRSTRVHLIQEALSQAQSVSTNDDPERLQRTCALLTEALAETYLELAENWLRRGQVPQAVKCLEQVVRSCSDTPLAVQAQARLHELTQS